MRSDVMGKTMAIFMVMAMIATGISTLIPNVAAGDPKVTGTVLSSVNPFDPISGVTVTYNNATDNITSTTTDSQGKFNLFVFNGEKEDYRLYFDKEGYFHRWRDFLATSYVGDVSETNTTLLKPLPRVFGIVKEMNAKTPLSNVEVNIIDKTDGWKVEMQVMTGTDGSFSCQVEAEQVDIYIKKTGYFSIILEDVSIDPDDGKNVGEIFLEMIEPTPTIKVWGVVLDQDDPDKPLPGALVSISEGDEKWITALSNAQGFYEMYAYPSNYQVKASLSGYYTNMSDEWLNVPSEKTAVKRNIFLEEAPAPNTKVNGTVSDSNGNLSGATVLLHSNDGRYSKSTSTNATGHYEIKFYSPGTYTLEVRMPNYFTNATIKDITGPANETHDIKLEEITENFWFRGYVYDLDSDDVIEDATVKIFDKDLNRLFTDSTSTDSNGYYEFNVTKDSNFAVLVDAFGYQSELYNVDTMNRNRYMEFGLHPSGMDTITTTYTFLDWNSIQATRINVITVDNVSVRLEADRRFGMGTLGLENNDRFLIEEEIDDWAIYLKNKGIEKRDTKEFLTLNNTYYLLNTTSYEVTIEGANGSVSADATIYINSTYNYTLAEELENPDSDIFELVLNATYDTEFVDRAYDIILPLAPVKYEMTSNTTDTNMVKVTGYNDPITIDPMVHDGDMETVTMTLERSLNGTAKAKVLSGIHHILNSTYDNYTVIVPMGPMEETDTTITFSAGDSTDDIGDITKANFTWDLGDGEWGYGMTVEHEYANISGELAVKLVITETGGNKTYRNITVWVDGQDPMARISALLHDTGNMTFDNANKKLTINEDMPVTFSGIMFSDVEGMDMADVVGDASYDDIKADDRKGIIDKWFWSWGEEDSFDETVTKDGSNNITHAYSKPGTYTLNMTATDVVGRESANATWTIEVRDITAPVADFNIKNANGNVVTEVIENEAFQYNASLTTDNYDELGDLTFKWFFDIGGGTIKEYTEMAINHTFSEVGTFNVTLKATDKNNNSENKTIVIHVNLGSRPNILMRLGTMAFSSTPGTAGKSMTISVNITNDGQANATNIQTTFYIRNPDGTDTVIGTDTTAFLGIAESETASLSWTPKKKGEYTIWANASCDQEHSSQWWDNKIDDFSVQRVEVQEAGWVMPAIIVSVVVIIILVFFGMKYFMKTGTKEEDYGEKRKKR